MNIKYTACLSSLLMVCPLAAQDVFAAGWEYSTSWPTGWFYGKDNESSNNTVTSLPDNYVAPGSVYIGYVRSSDSVSTASNNTFTYTGGKFDKIYVGKSDSADDNTIILTNAEADYVVCGSQLGGEDVTYNGNTIELNGGTYGHIEDGMPSGYITCARGEVRAGVQAKNNRIVLRGGTYSVSSITTAQIYWYELEVAQGRQMTFTNNSVELHVGTDGKSPVFHDRTVISGIDRIENSFPYSWRDGTFIIDSNSLKFYDVKGMTAGNIQHFQKLVFDYAEMHANDVILTLNGINDEDDEKTTSIANADVEVKVVNLYDKDYGEFKIGDKVVLLKNDNGLVTDGIKTKATITAETGISLTYEVEIQTNDEGTELILTRTGTKDGGDRDDTTVKSGTKAIAEGAAAGLALVNESSNATMEFLRDFSVSGGSITPFVHVQASSARHETGSSINVSAVSLMAGLGTGIETGAGKLSAAAFFEYGKGSYTTNNSFDDRSDIDGDGNSWYMGGGILAKMEFLQTGPGHFYLEGSAHMGTLHNEYDSNDLYDANGNVAKFDMDSPYYSLHGGMGYVWNMGCGHDLDIYGKYIWTRVQGTDDTLTTKDKFEYDDMDSNRVRFGVRYSYSGSERFKPYVGAAFEHEFSGSCESRAFGYNVATPSFEGSSGMGELGLMMKPTEDLPLSINLGVQGYVGQKQGISGSCNVMYEF